MILTSAFDPREHDFDPARRTKLERLYAEFAALVHEHGGDLDDIMQGEVRGVRRVVQFLRDIGKLWCDTGRSRQDYAELINSIWHRSDHWRTLISVAWAVGRRWQTQEPTQHAAPLPLALLKALVVWALVRGDFFMLLIGFAGGLRPGDFYGLRRRSLRFHTRGLFIVLSAELGDSDPKTARRGLARAQHVSG